MSTRGETRARWQTPRTLTVLYATTSEKLALRRSMRVGILNRSAPSEGKTPGASPERARRARRARSASDAPRRSDADANAPREIRGGSPGGASESFVRRSSPPFARPPDATDRRRGLWLAPPSARRPSRALLRMLQWHSPAPRARVRCYKSRGYGSTIHSVPRAGRANGDVFEVFGVVSRVIPFVSHHNTH